MSLLRLLWDRVRLLNPVEDTDGHGNPVDGYDPDRGMLVRARVVQETATETAGAAAASYSVWLPPTRLVTHRTRIEWRGDVYEVVGDPAEATGLAGRPSHISLTMRRAP